MRSVIANLRFYGRHDGSMKGDAAPGVVVQSGAPNISSYPLQYIDLADYRPDVKVIVLIGCAQWDPHGMDLQPDLKSSYVSWNATRPQVAILEVMEQDSSGGPATASTADQWARAYGLNFDVASDPQSVLQPFLAAESAFPLNIVIRTSDMTIQWIQAGNNPVGLNSAVNYALNH